MTSIREQGREAMRRALLDIASGLLLEDGVQALSTRKLAERAGASTTVIYTLFGGKDGLLEALYLEGFARLSAALGAVAEPEPLARLREMNQTYRRFALHNPAYYALMFERLAPQHLPSETALERAWQSLEPLIKTIGACMKSGRIPHAAPESVAMRFWVGAHGLVSLELAGYFRHQPELAAAMHEENISSLTVAPPHLEP